MELQLLESWRRHFNHGSWDKVKSGEEEQLAEFQVPAAPLRWSLKLVKLQSWKELQGFFFSVSSFFPSHLKIRKFDPPSPFTPPASHPSSPAPWSGLEVVSQLLGPHSNVSIPLRNYLTSPQAFAFLFTNSNEGERDPAGHPRANYRKGQNSPEHSHSSCICNCQCELRKVT